MDPLALLLPNEVYLDLKRPDPPPFEALVSRLGPAFKRLNATDKARTLAHAKALGAYAAAVEKALSPQAPSAG